MFIGAISEYTFMTVAQNIEQGLLKSQVGGTNRSPLSRENGFTTDYIAPSYMSHLPIEVVCATEAHLALHRSGVLCKGALF